MRRGSSSPSQGLARLLHPARRPASKRSTASSSNVRNAGRGSVGFVGEFGLGQRASRLFDLGLSSRRGRIVAGRVLLEGEDLLGRSSPDKLRRMRGAQRRHGLRFQGTR